MFSKILNKIFPQRNKPEHLLLGQTGEKLAARYLRRQAKMRILTKNYRGEKGEIDLVAQDGPELVFIEVKTRSGELYYTAEEAVDKDKQKNIIHTARGFISRYRLQKHPCRYDIVAVIIDSEHEPEIRHTKDAFGRTTGKRHTPRSL